MSERKTERASSRLKQPTRISYKNQSQQESPEKKESTAATQDTQNSAKKVQHRRQSNLVQPATISVLDQQMKKKLIASQKRASVTLDNNAMSNKLKTMTGDKDKVNSSALVPEGPRKSAASPVKSKLTFTRPSAMTHRVSEPKSSMNANKRQFTFNDKLVEYEQYPENKTHRDKKSGLFFSKQGLELARKPLFDLGEEELIRGHMEGMDESLNDASEQFVLANQAEVQKFRKQLASRKSIKREALVQKMENNEESSSSSQEEANNDRNSKINKEFVSDRMSDSDNMFDTLLERREQPRDQPVAPAVPQDQNQNNIGLAIKSLQAGKVIVPPLQLHRLSESSNRSGCQSRERSISQRLEDQVRATSVIAPDKSLNEPRIYANKLLGRKLNTRTKVTFRRISGQLVKIEEDMDDPKQRTQSTVTMPQSRGLLMSKSPAGRDTSPISAAAMGVEQMPMPDLTNAKTADPVNTDGRTSFRKSRVGTLIDIDEIRRRHLEAKEQDLQNKQKLYEEQMLQQRLKLERDQKALRDREIQLEMQQLERVIMGKIKAEIVRIYRLTQKRLALEKKEKLLRSMKEQNQKIERDLAAQKKDEELRRKQLADAERNRLKESEDKARKDELERQRIEQLRKEEDERFNNDLMVKLQEIYRRRSSAKRGIERTSSHRSEESHKSRNLKSKGGSAHDLTKLAKLPIEDQIKIQKDRRMRELKVSPQDVMSQAAHSELNMDETIPLALDRKDLELTAMMTERDLINSLGPDENRGEPQLILDDVDNEDVDTEASPAAKGNRSRSQKSLRLNMPVTPLSRLQSSYISMSVAPTHQKVTNIPPEEGNLLLKSLGFVTCGMQQNHVTIAEPWVDLSNMATCCLLIGDNMIMQKNFSVRYMTHDPIAYARYLLLTGESKRLSKLKSDLIKKGRFNDMQIQIDENQTLQLNYISSVAKTLEEIKSKETRLDKMSVLNRFSKYMSKMEKRLSKPKNKALEELLKLLKTMESEREMFSAINELFDKEQDITLELVLLAYSLWPKLGQHEDEISLLDKLFLLHSASRAQSEQQLILLIYCKCILNFQDGFYAQKALFLLKQAINTSAGQFNVIPLLYSFGKISARFNIDIDEGKACLEAVVEYMESVLDDEVSFTQHFVNTYYYLGKLAQNKMAQAHWWHKWLACTESLPRRSALKVFVVVNFRASLGEKDFAYIALAYDVIHSEYAQHFNYLKVLSTLKKHGLDEAVGLLQVKRIREHQGTFSNVNVGSIELRLAKLHVMRQEIGKRPDLAIETVREAIYAQSNLSVSSQLILAETLNLLDCSGAPIDGLVNLYHHSLTQYAIFNILGGLRSRFVPTNAACVADAMSDFKKFKQAYTDGEQPNDIFEQLGVDQINLQSLMAHMFRLDEIIEHIESRSYGLKHLISKRHKDTNVDQEQEPGWSDVPQHLSWRPNLPATRKHVGGSKSPLLGKAPSRLLDMSKLGQEKGRYFEDPVTPLTATEHDNELMESKYSASQMTDNEWARLVQQAGTTGMDVSNLQIPESLAASAFDGKSTSPAQVAQMKPLAPLLPSKLLLKITWLDLQMSSKYLKHILQQTKSNKSVIAGQLTSNDCRCSYLLGQVLKQAAESARALILLCYAWLHEGRAHEQFISEKEASNIIEQCNKHLEGFHKFCDSFAL